MTQKKKPVVAQKTTKSKKKQPFPMEIALHQRQEELELINKELTQSRMDLQAYLRQYTDLYDFAPVGYFTLARDGTIRQVNLAGANLVGVEHNKLSLQRLQEFISSECRPDYDAFFEKLLSREGKEVCELALEKNETRQTWARLEATCFEGGDTCRVMLTNITERVQAQDALRESEERFRMLFDRAPLGYQSLDADGKFIYVNQSWLDALGYTRAEVLGHWFGEFLSPEYVESFRQQFPIFKTSGQVHSEFEMLHKNGSWRWMVFEGRVGYELNGNFKQTHCILQDFTERKQAEDALRESQEMFSLFMRHSPIYTYIKSVTPTESRVLQASDNFQQMIGISGQDMLGKTMAELFPAEFAAKITADDWDVSVNGDVLKLDEDLNGRHYTTIKFPIKLGNKTLLAGYTIDITERKQAEEALLASEARNRALVEAIPDLMFVQNRAGVFIDYHATRPQLLVALPEDLLGRTTQDVLPPALAQELQLKFDLAFQTGEPQTLEYVMDLVGERRYFEARMNAYGEDRVLSIIRDITERKLAEVELQYMREGLKAANIELQNALARQQQLARIDGLTGVNNRRSLYELAEHEFEIATRYQQPLSVIMFDIDHFKQVNDTFGHAAGDQMLQRVMKVTCAELRSADVIGRYGGEEFVIVLPMTNAQQAYPLAERIRLAVTAIRVPTEKGEAAVTLSIGIVEIHHGAQIGSMENLIRRADEIMYTAKQAGRNRTEIGNA